MLVPSMNVLVKSELIAPAWTCRAFPPSCGADTVTPGASAAKFRKLRSPFGRFSSWKRETLVPTEGVLTSLVRAPTTTIAAPAAVVGAARSTVTDCPSGTTTFCDALPDCTRYVLGGKPTIV